MTEEELAKIIAKDIRRVCFRIIAVCFVLAGLLQAAAYFV